MPTKKHKLKVKEKREHIEGDFDIAAFDLGLRRPGMAILHYDSENRSVKIVRKTHISNKFQNKKCHGQILSEICDVIADLLARSSVKIAVRERAFSRFNAETQTLNKVVGVSDMILWQLKRDTYEEYSPATIKKCVTGYARAEKEDVAKAILNYCPGVTFAVDDESDAVAVGITFLIDNGYIDTIPYEKYLDKLK